MTGSPEGGAVQHTGPMPGPAALLPDSSWHLHTHYLGLCAQAAPSQRRQVLDGRHRLVLGEARGQTDGQSPGSRRAGSWGWAAGSGLADWLGWGMSRAFA